MVPKKICLFTAHSPKGGGGAVILNSLIDKLPNIELEWKYVANLPAKGFEKGYLGRGLMGGKLLPDIWNTYLMLSDKNCSIINDITDKLLKVECDVYWIVSHNEGLRIALELKRAQPNKPIHLTIHDDWEGALCARSRRYRFYGKLVRKITISVLNQVNSFDVVSTGMQSYYEKISGKNGVVIHRYLPEIKTIKKDRLNINRDNIKIGHIGSLYKKKDFLYFLKLLKLYGLQKDVSFSIHLWGSKMDFTDVSEDLRTLIYVHEDLPEKEVVEKLKECTFVYAMYPFDENYSIFRKTSLPTKLSSYVLAQIPIFGHAPYDSTLSDFLLTTKTGHLWSNSNVEEGFKIIDMLINKNILSKNWSSARDRYFSEKNLTNLQVVMRI